MNVKKILKQLRKPDDYTDKTISEEYPADWNADEIFEKSFENYMMQKDNSERYEILSVTEERKIQRYSGMLQALIPAAACAAIIIVLGSLSSEHKPDDEITPLVSVTETSVITETQTLSSGTSEAVTDSTESTAVKEYVTVINEVSEDYEDYEKALVIQNAETSYNYSGEEHNYTENVKTEEESFVKTEPAVTYITEVTEAVQTAEINDKNMRRLTVEELFALSEKGDELDWSDFKEFRSEDISSEDLHIEKYEVESDLCMFYLVIGGVPEEKPYYLHFYSEFTDEIDPVDVKSQEFIQFRKVYELFGL